MSDNHEKFQNGFDPNNGSEPVNTNTSANNAVNSTNAYGTYHNAQYPTCLLYTSPCRFAGGRGVTRVAQIPRAGAYAARGGL